MGAMVVLRGSTIPRPVKSVHFWFGFPASGGSVPLSNDTCGQECTGVQLGEARILEPFSRNVFCEITRDP